MDIHTRIADMLGDDRLLANLVGLHAVLGLMLIVSFLARRVLIHGSDHLVRWTGLHWLDHLNKEATRRVRALLFWVTVSAMFLTLVIGAAYHLAGRDIRLDVAEWYKHLTGEDLLLLGLALGELVLLSLATFVAVRQVRRFRIVLQSHATHWLMAHHRHEAAETLSEVAPPPHDQTVKRWFFLLERYAIVVLLLGALWCTGRIVHLSEFSDRAVGFLMRVFTIIAVARLLTLACHTLSRSLAALGNRHLGQGKFRRYWERVTRLFPFGERCFEAAVYVSAASLCIRELEFVAFVADFGPRLVQCIGLFFTTRVLIELVQALLNEAFGISDEDRPIDQKGQTLVPLLQSICQYVLYFGSAVMMLGVLGIDTHPILAGAGILGLAGALGAQSLITDVVSGFFILFENQYLVGDVVQIGDAQGRVEAVSIRHTQIRDEQGKLYIIPNGQIKSVINFSKGYVNAVVDIKVPTTANVADVMYDMAEAGKRLKQNRREVLADTLVKGLVDLTPNDMTLRAVTKVQPGTHLAMQCEYRRLLKESFDRRRSEAAAAPSYQVA